MVEVLLKNVQYCVPTLVWRNEHLDQNHIFENSNNLYLCNYDDENIKYFFKNYKKFCI